MKNTKTKIILSAIIFLSVVGFVGTVDAASSSLYISPATLTKTAGNIFSVSVGVDAVGSKVCAVEGTLAFNNLSCQSITVTVADDVKIQSSPTCSNPYFLIGIQNCTTTNRVLLTASVKAGNAGVASISFSNVDIIGEGVSVGSASTSSSYTINTLSVTSTPQPEQATAPETTNNSTTKDTIVTTESSETTTTLKTDLNQLAALTGSSFALGFFGWIWSNIIWILVLIVAIVVAYITGRISCIKNKKIDILPDLWKKWINK